MSKKPGHLPTSNLVTGKDHSITTRISSSNILLVLSHYGAMDSASMAQQCIGQRLGRDDAHRAGRGVNGSRFQVPVKGRKMCMWW